ncbi:MAG: hypothetical protein ABIS47_13740 [Acidimicrobiales bacterium]
MRRTALVLPLMAMAVATGAVLHRGPAPGHPGVDPGPAARRAGDLAAAGPLLVTLADAGGVEVARARLEGDRAAITAGDLTGGQQGDRLDVLGTAVQVPASDPRRLLAPLTERPARWEGHHLRLDGAPPARAWLDGTGRLARLEVDLDGGGQLVVAPDP